MARPLIEWLPWNPYPSTIGNGWRVRRWGNHRKTGERVTEVARNRTGHFKTFKTERAAATEAAKLNGES